MGVRIGLCPGDAFRDDNVVFSGLSRFNRDWRYHKEERVWITRAPGMEPTLKTNAYERGTYYFFDCLNWRKVAKVTLLKHVASVIPC